MANPLFKAFGNRNQGNNIMGQFQNFMNQMKGQNPNDILNNMISSGQINQKQLNQVQAAAKQMSGQFESIRSMFGFK